MPIPTIGLDPGPRRPGVTIAAIFLWPGCEMDCRFCASERDFRTMDLPWALRLLEGLAARGYRNLVLGGGEPARWPHGIEHLATAARGRGFLVQLNTNGVRRPPGFPRVPGVDRLILPLEAARADVHDGLRTWDGDSHFALVRSRIDECLTAGTELTISTVLTARNVDQVEPLADWLAALHRRGARLHAWHLYRFLPVGRGGARNRGELVVSRERFLDACGVAKGRGLGFPVYRRSDMLRSSTVEFFWREADGLHRGGEGRGQERPPTRGERFSRADARAVRGWTPS